MKLELFWQRGTILGLPVVTPMNTVFDIKVEPEYCDCPYCRTIERCGMYARLKKALEEKQVRMP